MAANIPGALKSADISRFAQRAAQVEKAKPVVAYWCNYWIVNQILSKGLHTADDECMTYTMSLMDKLEQTKAEHTEDDIVIDDVAGQAYIEQFGFETLQRADNAMRANKASRQTADTLQAAATFLDLCHIWGPLDPETAAKIKFAKYHALRIARAIKADEDPNLTNPAPELPPANEQQALHPNDPDVQTLNDCTPLSRDLAAAYQPSIEEVPDEHDRLVRHMAQRSSLDESLHPSRVHSTQRQPNQGQSDIDGAFSTQENNEENYYSDAPASGVSLLDPSVAGRKTPDGGGYFPNVPDSVETTHQPRSEAPPEDMKSQLAMDLPDSSALPPPTSLSTPFMRPPDIPPVDLSKSSLPPHPIYPPSVPRYPPPHVSPHPSQPSVAPDYALGSSQQIPQFRQPPHTLQGGPSLPAAPASLDSQITYVADEEAILKAQKHARWAISALNFEDVSTAIKELRGALGSLGAR